ncbi:MAG: YciI family protein [Micromonosporaceae bacterium]|nr:YciI family protein [Micromonosporaceae bacterium]
MRYMLLMHNTEESVETIGAEKIEAGQAAFTVYTATLAKAGVLVSADALQPTANTTTLRIADGSLLVQDGPFADTKEQLGGVIVIDVSNLDAAIDWARQAPPVQWGGAVEIRPGGAYTVDGVWVANG